MNDLLTTPIPLWWAFAYMIFMCAVQTLPRPEQNASPLYIWIFGFLHLLCMNLALFVDPAKKLKMLETTTTTTTTSTDPPPAPPPPQG
jgi:hypothetical protein